MLGSHYYFMHLLPMSSINQFICSTISLFSWVFQALAVFVLYVRCTAIDPADPGILMTFDETLAHRSRDKVDLPGKWLTIIFLVRWLSLIP